MIAPAAQRSKWPADAFDQAKLVRDLLAEAPDPMPVEGIVVAFDGRVTDRRRQRVRQVLDTLAATGAARIGEGGELLRTALSSTSSAVATHRRDAPV